MTDTTAIQKNDLRSFINQKKATGLGKKETPVHSKEIRTRKLQLVGKFAIPATS